MRAFTRRQWVPCVSSCDTLLLFFSVRTLILIRTVDPLFLDVCKMLADDDTTLWLFRTIADEIVLLRRYLSPAM